MSKLSTFIENFMVVSLCRKQRSYVMT